MTLKVKLILRLESLMVKEPLLSAVIHMPLRFFIIEIPESYSKLKLKGMFKILFEELTNINLKQAVFALSVNVLLLYVQFETNSIV